MAWVVFVVIIAKQSNPFTKKKHFIKSRTNKNIFKRIKYLYNNEINSNYLHYIEFHQQTPFACLTNAYTCIYMRSSWFGNVLRHTRATRTFMDPCGPGHVYALCGHLSLLFFMSFPFLFFPKRLYHPPYHRQSYDRLSPSPQHHVWLHPPIFSCLLRILLLFERTISP